MIIKLNYSLNGKGSCTPKTCDNFTDNPHHLYFQAVDMVMIYTCYRIFHVRDFKDRAKHVLLLKDMDAIV